MTSPTSRAHSERLVESKAIHYNVRQKPEKLGKISLPLVLSPLSFAMLVVVIDTGVFLHTSRSSNVDSVLY